MSIMALVTYKVEAKLVASAPGLDASDGSLSRKLGGGGEAALSVSGRGISRLASDRFHQAIKELSDSIP